MDKISNEEMLLIFLQVCEEKKIISFNSTKLRSKIDKNILNIMEMLNKNNNMNANQTLRELQDLIYQYQKEIKKEFFYFGLAQGTIKENYNF